MSTLFCRLLRFILFIFNMLFHFHYLYLHGDNISSAILISWLLHQLRYVYSSYSHLLQNTQSTSAQINPILFQKGNFSSALTELFSDNISLQSTYSNKLYLLNHYLFLQLINTSIQVAFNIHTSPDQGFSLQLPGLLPLGLVS